MNFTIEGDPVGKGRPKFARRGNFVTAYTPKKTVDYEEYVRECFIKSGGEIQEGALKIAIVIYCSIPKSTPKKNIDDMLNAYVRPTKKPDADNIAKLILDSLNKVAYNDDSQIVDLYISKWYGEKAKTVVTITPV